MDDALSPLAYGPPRAAAFGLVALAALCVLVALGVDPAGRVLLGVAAAGLLGAAAWVVRGPALEADETGLRIRGALATHAVGWVDVVVIGVDQRRRSRAVEIETTEQLLAVPAVLLGRISPSRVARELQEAAAEWRARSPATPTAG